MFLQKHAKGSNMHERCEGTPKGTQKRKKVKPYLKLMASVHLNMDYVLRGIGFGGSPIGYAGLMSCFKVQGNFLLLCSSNNFVGYSYLSSALIDLFSKMSS